MFQDENVDVKEVKVSEFDLLKFKIGAISDRDAPTLYGKTPERTVLDLWNDKTDLSTSSEKEPDDPHIIEMARNLFNQKSSWLHLMPAFCENKSMSFLNAILDAIDIDQDVFARIAILDPREFEALEIDAKIPDRNWIEIQHQYRVTGFKHGFFVATIDGTQVAYAPVGVDECFQSNHTAECIQFWDLVRRGIEPKDRAEMSFHQ